MVVYIGIDPGQKGALVALDSEGSVRWMDPFDKGDPARIMRRSLTVLARAAVVGLELVHAMPGQGVVSMFNFGLNYGRIQGALKVIGCEFSLISPQVWQSWIKWTGEPKASVKGQVRERWGLEQFIQPGCRTPHQGCMDAACIAEYMRLLASGQIAGPKPRRKVKKRKVMKL